MTPADLERFRKICGMLSSAHDGERAAAARKASEFLASHGLTWSSVSLPVEQPDVLAQRREAMHQNMRETPSQAAPFEDAIRAAKNAKAADRAARQAQWKEARYGADSDGFEPGRK